MSTAKRLHGFAFALLMLILILLASAAVAAGALTVELEGITLSAANPYWKNGGGGSAADWNVFIDTGTPVPTLYLNSAQMSTVNSYGELLYADGNIHVVLLGTNSLRYTGDETLAPAGLAADGDIVLSDGTSDASGTLIIEILPDKTTFMTDGIYTDTGNVTIESGIIDITVSDGYISYGLYADDSLYIRGGTISVHSSGLGVTAVSAYDVNITGGTIDVTAEPEFDDGHALLFYQLLFTGGYGRFSNIKNGYAAIWDPPISGNFRVTGGRLVFQSRDQQALYFHAEESVDPLVSERIYASTLFTGVDKTLWNASRGILAGNMLEDSQFRYVEMIGSLEQPVTGDTSRPWLWLMMAGLALFAGAVLVFRRRKSV